MPKVGSCVNEFERNLLGSIAAGLLEQGLSQCDWALLATWDASLRPQEVPNEQRYDSCSELNGSFDVRICNASM